MVLLDLVGLVLVFTVVGVIFLVVSPVIIFFIQINRKLWGVLNRNQRKHQSTENDGDGSGSLFQRPMVPKQAIITAVRFTTNDGLTREP